MEKLDKTHILGREIYIQVSALTKDFIFAATSHILANLCLLLEIHIKIGRSKLLIQAQSLSHGFCDCLFEFCLRYTSF